MRLVVVGGDLLHKCESIQSVRGSVLIICCVPLEKAGRTCAVLPSVAMDVIALPVYNLPVDVRLEFVSTLHKH